MSRWVHRGVTVPRLDDEDWDDVVPSLGIGGADSSEAELTLGENELEREKRKRREALKRKRPAGFAPWPEDA